jgi:hypothetical protein
MRPMIVLYRATGDGFAGTPSERTLLSRRRSRPDRTRATFDLTVREV